MVVNIRHPLPPGRNVLVALGLACRRRHSPKLRVQRRQLLIGPSVMSSVPIAPSPSRQALRQAAGGPSRPHQEVHHIVASLATWSTRLERRLDLIDDRAEPTWRRRRPASAAFPALPPPPLLRLSAPASCTTIADIEPIVTAYVVVVVVVVIVVVIVFAAKPFSISAHGSMLLRPLASPLPLPLGADLG